jgi:hypothetical protein
VTDLARRPVWQAWMLLLLAGLVGAMLFLVAWRVGGSVSAGLSARSTDDLAWLERRFQVEPGRMETIRDLHEAYVPECANYCREIASAKGRLQALLAAGDLADPAIESTLAEIGRWRAKCQAGMLRHFQAVAAAMPPEQGAAYLAEMERLTIGSHEQIEERMAGQPAEGTETHVHGAGH